MKSNWDKYKWVERRIFDKHVDRMQRQYDRLKADYKALRRLVKDMDEFLSVGPHGSVWKPFRAERE